MTNENEAHDPTPARPSRLGKALVAQGAINLVVIACVACAYFAWSMSDEDFRHRTWGFANVTVLVSLGVSALLGFVGSCLALAGLLRKNRRRGMLAVGLLSNRIILFASALGLFGLFSVLAGLADRTAKKTAHSATCGATGGSSFAPTWSMLCSFSSLTCFFALRTAPFSE